MDVSPFTFQPLKCGMNPDQCQGRTTTLCGFDSLLQKLLQKPFLLLCQNGELVQWMPNNILIATDRKGSFGSSTPWAKSKLSRSLFLRFMFPINFLVSVAKILLNP